MNTKRKPTPQERLDQLDREIAHWEAETKAAKRLGLAHPGHIAVYGVPGCFPALRAAKAERKRLEKRMTGNR